MMGGGAGAGGGRTLESEKKEEARDRRDVWQGAGDNHSLCKVLSEALFVDLIQYKQSGH